MDEEAKLRAKIAGLKGQINQKKRGEPYPSPAPYAPPQSYATRHPNRWPARGRVGRVGYHHPRASQNHVWRAAGTQTPPPSEPVASSDADEPVTPPAGTNPRNGYVIPPPSAGKMELMSKDTYEREQKQKQEYRNARMAGAPSQATPHTPTPSTSLKDQQNIRQIIVEGITFQVNNDGSKLMRVSGECTSPLCARCMLNSIDLSNVLQETPKKTCIAGIDFHRTKHGNLMRAPAQRDSTRYTDFRPQLTRQAWLNPPPRFNTAAPKAQCETFTRQGNPATLQILTRLAHPRAGPGPIPAARELTRPLLTPCRFLPLRPQVPLRPRPGEGCHLQRLPHERQLSHRRLL